MRKWTSLTWWSMRSNLPLKGAYSRSFAKFSAPVCLSSWVSHSIQPAYNSAIPSEDSLEHLITSSSNTEPGEVTTQSTSSVNQKTTKKDKTSLKQKLGNYADVLKGIMQTVCWWLPRKVIILCLLFQMMDPSGNSLEVEELLDEVIVHRLLRKNMVWLDLLVWCLFNILFKFHHKVRVASKTI